MSVMVRRRVDVLMVLVVMMVLVVVRRVRVVV